MANAGSVRKGLLQDKSKPSLSLVLTSNLQLTDLKVEYDSLRKRYFRFEDTLKTQLNDEELAYTTTQAGANMKAT